VVVIEHPRFFLGEDDDPARAVRESFEHRFAFLYAALTGLYPWDTSSTLWVRLVYNVGRLRHHSGSTVLRTLLLPPTAKAALGRRPDVTGSDPTPPDGPLLVYSAVLGVEIDSQGLNGPQASLSGDVSRDFPSSVCLFSASFGAHQREQDDLTDARNVGQDHGEAVDPESEPAGGWHPVFKGSQEI